MKLLAERKTHLRLDLPLAVELCSVQYLVVPITINIFFFFYLSVVIFSHRTAPQIKNFFVKVVCSTRYPGGKSHSLHIQIFWYPRWRFWILQWCKFWYSSSNTAWLVFFLFLLKEENHFKSLSSISTSKSMILNSSKAASTIW